MSHPPPAPVTRSAPERPAASHWRFSILDAEDVRAVAAYEAALYRRFAPTLATNPLIRDLWVWDDAEGRLRTRVPYASQRVGLISEPGTGTIAYSIAANADVGAFWQSGAYGFAPPPAGEQACEFMITAGARVHALVVIRRFLYAFFFGALLDAGFRYAYGTSADRLRRLYGLTGAEVWAEREVRGHRRTLFRWDLDRLRR